eukprot:TRINITY_DN3206_c0_g1_i5.p1 TRINITY_DN3206_c0_g1~~TRINITY_DN3206_c0_g1_i5.p1  ORF type:complete len:104 (+),score=12.02 TRINITY_DN3206_c0_g1_i5:177-488(+)
MDCTSYETIATQHHSFSVSAIPRRALTLLAVMLGLENGETFSTTIPWAEIGGSCSVSTFMLSSMRMYSFTRPSMVSMRTSVSSTMDEMYRMRLRLFVTRGSVY